VLAQADAGRRSPGRRTRCGSREPGTPLVVYDCHGGENQRFTYPPVSGTGEVRAYGGTMCLDAYTGRGQDGDRIVVWPCHGGANQQWTRTLGGELRGVNGKCIDVLGARTEHLTDVWLWTCHGGANQRWNPAPVTAAADGAR